MPRGKFEGMERFELLTRGRLLSVILAKDGEEPVTWIQDMGKSIFKVIYYDENHLGYTELPVNEDYDVESGTIHIVKEGN